MTMRADEGKAPWARGSVDLGAFLRRRAEAVLRRRRRVGRRADPGAVHDLRVATRRLQEAIFFCGASLPRAVAERTARRARRIRRGLGPVRDADVMLDLLRRLARRLRGGERDVALTLAARLRAEARVARGGADGGGSLAVPGIRKRLRALLKAAGARPLALGARGRRLALERLERAGRLLKRARRGEAAGLHAFRIGVKRYRYGLEILDEAGVRGLHAAIREARDLQRALGRIHDLDVLATLVARRGGPADSAPVATRRRLLERLRAERAAALRSLDVRLARFRPRERATAIMPRAREGGA